ncbi:uncharacterized protein B0H18DRAFT_971015 [Fomitopsis serialis]|uniref:uncharacterized protein n=1 Tax=Fomitopsis serialis TaxID=139415 RepID=UPI0020087B39|nr:uncharacterized protein B0H18DRAFT_971015 [Neoantrodia serialis]KAH9937515.1 hypothetical protein B0H18DRAFT_971015 [Neoantrodia serialis]
MRSPVIAFSLFAAAAVVSASTNGLSGSPVLGPNTLSPKPGSVNLDNSELKNHVHRQDSGAEITRTGLGISKLGASSPAHQKRAPVRQHSNIAEVEARPAEHSPAPPPRPERPVTGGVVGCNDPDTGSEGSAVVENALNSGNENGGVSCSSSAQGASAGDIGQNGESGPDAKSQDAAPGSDALNQDLDGVLSKFLGARTGASFSPEQIKVKVTGHRAKVAATLPSLRQLQRPHCTYPVVSAPSLLTRLRAHSTKW